MPMLLSRLSAMVYASSYGSVTFLYWHDNRALGLAYLSVTFAALLHALAEYAQQQRHQQAAIQLEERDRQAITEMRRRLLQSLTKRIGKRIKRLQARQSQSREGRPEVDEVKAAAGADGTVRPPGPVAIYSRPPAVVPADATAQR